MEGYIIAILAWIGIIGIGVGCYMEGYWEGRRER
jgi:hypothetical protein